MRLLAVAAAIVVDVDLPVVRLSADAPPPARVQQGEVAAAPDARRSLVDAGRVPMCCEDDIYETCSTDSGEPETGAPPPPPPSKMDGGELAPAPAHHNGMGCGGESCCPAGKGLCSNMKCQGCETTADCTFGAPRYVCIENLCRRAGAVNRAEAEELWHAQVEEFREALDGKTVIDMVAFARIKITNSNFPGGGVSTVCKHLECDVTSPDDVQAVLTGAYEEHVKSAALAVVPGPPPPPPGPPKFITDTRPYRTVYGCVQKGSKDGKGNVCLTYRRDQADAKWANRPFDKEDGGGPTKENPADVRRCDYFGLAESRWWRETLATEVGASAHARAEFFNKDLLTDAVLGGPMCESEFNPYEYNAPSVHRARLDEYLARAAREVQDPVWPFDAKLPCEGASVDAFSFTRVTAKSMAMLANIRFAGTGRHASSDNVKFSSDEFRIAQEKVRVLAAIACQSCKPLEGAEAKDTPVLRPGKCPGVSEDEDKAFSQRCREPAWLGVTTEDGSVAEAFEVERVRSFRKKWVPKLGLGDHAKHVWNWRPVIAGKCDREDKTSATEYRKLSDHTLFASVHKQVRVRALELLTDDFTWYDAWDARALKEERLAALLRAMWEDPDRDVRIAAVRSLEKVRLLAGKAGADELAALLLVEQDWGVKNAILDALVKMGPQSSGQVRDSVVALFVQDTSVDAEFKDLAVDYRNLVSDDPLSCAELFGGGTEERVHLGVTYLHEVLFYKLLEFTKDFFDSLKVAVRVIGALHFLDFTTDRASWEEGLKTVINVGRSNMLNIDEGQYSLYHRVLEAPVERLGKDGRCSGPTANATVEGPREVGQYDAWITQFEAIRSQRLSLLQKYVHKKQFSVKRAVAEALVPLCPHIGPAGEELLEDMMRLDVSDLDVKRLHSDVERYYDGGLPGRKRPGGSGRSWGPRAPVAYKINIASFTSQAEIAMQMKAVVMGTFVSLGDVLHKDRFPLVSSLIAPQDPLVKGPSGVGPIFKSQALMDKYAVEGGRPAIPLLRYWTEIRSRAIEALGKMPKHLATAENKHAILQALVDAATGEDQMSPSMRKSLGLNDHRPRKKDLSRAAKYSAYEGAIPGATDCSGWPVRTLQRTGRLPCPRDVALEALGRLGPVAGAKGMQAIIRSLGSSRHRLAAIEALALVDNEHAVEALEPDTGRPGLLEAARGFFGDAAMQAAFRTLASLGDAGGQEAFELFKSAAVQPGFESYRLLAVSGLGAMKKFERPAVPILAHFVDPSYAMDLSDEDRAESDEQGLIAHPARAPNEPLEYQEDWKKRWQDPAISFHALFLRGRAAIGLGNVLTSKLHPAYHLLEKAKAIAANRMLSGGYLARCAEYALSAIRDRVAAFESMQKARRAQEDTRLQSEQMDREKAKVEAQLETEREVRATMLLNEQQEQVFVWSLLGGGFLVLSVLAVAWRQARGLVSKLTERRDFDKWQAKSAPPPRVFRTPGTGPTPLRVCSWRCRASTNAFEFWTAENSRVVQRVDDFLADQKDLSHTLADVLPPTRVHQLNGLLQAKQLQPVPGDRTDPLGAFHTVVQDYFLKPDAAWQALVEQADKSCPQRPAATTPKAYPGAFDDLDAWFKAWYKYMHDEGLSRLKPCKSSRLSREEQKLSVPLQVLHLCLYDALCVFLLNRAAPGWLEVKRAFVTRDALESCAEVLRKYLDHDAVLLQEAPPRLVDLAKKRFACFGSRPKKPGCAVLLPKGKDARDETARFLQSAADAGVGGFDACVVWTQDAKGRELVYASLRIEDPREASPLLTSLVAFAGAAKLIVGTSGDTAGKKSLDPARFPALLKSLDLHSCVPPHAWTTHCARTFLQPRKERAVHGAALAAGADRAVRDHIVSSRSVFFASTLVDTTGECSFRPGPMPTPQLPTENAVVSTQILYR